MKRPAHRQSRGPFKRIVHTSGFRNLRCRIRFPRRVWLQYKLRSFLIITLVVCLVLGWYAERVRRQRRAVAALVADGAAIYYYDRDDLSFFDADDFSAGNTVEKPKTIAEYVEFLTPFRLRKALGVDFFRRVDAVAFSGDDDFPHDPTPLRDLIGLRHLDLHNALDEDLAVVGDLGDLTDLCLRHSIISDAGLAHVGKLRKLEHLDISFDEESDSTLSHQPITDVGLVHLANLRRLKDLGLAGSAIGGEGLRYLAAMTDLEDLDLGKTKLTDAALVHLVRLPRLKWLDIHDTVITRGLAEEVLPNTRITRNDRASAALTPAQALVHAGRWTQALGTLNPNAHPERDFAAYRIGRLELYNIGRCHAELGHVPEATESFCNLLQQLQDSPPRGGPTMGELWQHVYEWPQVFEHVGRARPHDIWRWITSARRAVIDGRWSDASADYGRAIELADDEILRADWDMLLLECGVSRVLMGDLQGHERLCARTADIYRGTHQEVLGRLPELNGRDFVHDYWPQTREDVWHVWLVAPQGTVSASQLSDWHGQLSPAWDAYLSPSLLYLRMGEFQKALEDEPPRNRMYLGSYWFCRAMAHMHMEQMAQARDCYARGAHWLARHLKDDRLRGGQRHAAHYIECEALRREAQRMIF